MSRQAKWLESKGWRVVLRKKNGCMKRILWASPKHGNNPMPQFMAAMFQHLEDEANKATMKVQR